MSNDLLSRGRVLKRGIPLSPLGRTTFHRPCYTQLSAHCVRVGCAKFPHILKLRNRKQHPIDRLQDKRQRVAVGYVVGTVRIFWHRDLLAVRTSRRKHKVFAVFRVRTSPNVRRSTLADA